VGNNNQLAMNALEELSYQYITFLTGEETKPQAAVCNVPSEWPFPQILNRSALVIRNYWAADCQNQDKVITAPLLVTKSATPSWTEHCGPIQAPTLQFGKPPSQRTRFLYFSSSHKLSKRTEFVQTVIQTMPQELQSDPINKVVLKYRPLGVNWNTDEENESYGSVMADTKFAAVLPGNVEETWRFYESLFCGTIPLLEKSVYEYYQPWLPTSLMEMIPFYNNSHHLTTLLHTLYEEARDMTQFSDHNLAIRSAAQSWLNDIRSNLGDRIRQVALERQQYGY
jgi:hypothetical protein